MTNAIDRRTSIGGALAFAMTGLGHHALAQSFPSKPVRWVIPFAPGGNYDVTSRLVGEVMGRKLRQTIVAENRPGAGGIVGLEAAANAPADGYTVVMASFSVMWIAPYLARKPPKVPLFAPISLLTTVPTLVLTLADSRFGSIKSAFAEAKAKPGTVSIGIPGNGTTNHVAILRLQVNEKVAFNVIPYKGSGPGLADLLAGQIDLYADQITSSLHIRSGKLRPLLALSDDRIVQLPEVPSLREIGSQRFDGGTTAGLFARSETPVPMLDVLNEAVVAALKDGEVERKLVDLGAAVRPTTRSDFAAYMKDQETGVSELVKSGLLKRE